MLLYIRTACQGGLSGISSSCTNHGRPFTGTLTQNDMQVVRMWIGGSDFRALDQLQPPEPGMLSLLTISCTMCKKGCICIPKGNVQPSQLPSLLEPAAANPATQTQMWWMFRHRSTAIQRFRLRPQARLLCVGAVADDVWQDIPLGLDPRVRDLLGNSVALNTTASVKQDQESSKQCAPPTYIATPPDTLAPCLNNLVLVICVT